MDKFKQRFRPFSKFALLLAMAGPSLAMGSAEAVIHPPDTSASLSTQVQNQRGTDRFASKKTYWSTGIGTSDLLSIRMERPFHDRQSMGVLFSYLPIALFVDDLKQSRSSNLSENYMMETALTAHVFSVGLFHDYYFTPRVFIETQASLLILNASGTAHFKNKATQNSTEVAKLNMTVYQPITSLTVGWAAYRARGWRLDLGGGISYLFPYSVQTQISGTAPSFFEVAPEYRDSVTSGRQEMEADALAALERLPYRYPILPSLFVRGRW